MEITTMASFIGNSFKHEPLRWCNG